MAVRNSGSDSKKDRILLKVAVMRTTKSPGSFESGLLWQILFPSPGNTAGAIISKVKFQKLFGTVLNTGITVWNTLWRRVAGLADTLYCTLGEGMGFLEIEKRLLRQRQDLFRGKASKILSNLRFGTDSNGIAGKQIIHSKD